MLRARVRRLPLGVLLERLGKLLLGHVRAALDAGLLGVLVELLLRLVRVDAAVGAFGVVARAAAGPLGLRVRRALLVLELPVVALLLGDVLDGGERGAVRALLRVVLLVGRVERLLVGVLHLLRRALDRAGEVFLFRWHTVGLPAPQPRNRLLQRRRGLRRQPPREHARGLLRRERVRLPGPQVQALRVAALARGRTQRRGDVVDVRVGARRLLGVLAHEAVDDPARGATAERARERGRGLAGERLAVYVGGAGLRRAHERGAERRGGGAGREHGGDGAAGCQPAGGDQRKVDRRGDELERGEHAQVRGRVVVLEHGAMPARLDALDDEGVDVGTPPRKTHRAPPASTPWTTRASAPASRAIRASAGLVTVTHASAPAACMRSKTADSGQPNVNVTSGRRSASATASFDSQPSSSCRGSPSSPSSHSRAAYVRTASSSAGPAGGAKMLSPNGRAVSPRSVSRSARTASAVL